MSEAAKRQMTLGMIVGNRGFFPDHLARSGHQEMKAALESAGVKVIALTEAESKFGAVETRPEAKRCADLFKKHREAIDGIVVTLPNFGDERAIADTLRMADLRCRYWCRRRRIRTSKMSIRDRRDSFCGKMSACNNLTQYGIPYSLTTSAHRSCHIRIISRRTWNGFSGVCRVVKGLRRLRVGAIGARPTAFNTVRYSEKILEASGISVETTRSF